VVIPTRDRLRYLQEAVASVLGQDLAADWEVVVVDDASSDGTWLWLESITDERVRRLRRDEPGERAAARNAGLAEARAEAVLFLDDDDRLHPTALRRLTAALARHPDAFAAVGARRSFGTDGRYRYPFPRWPVARAVWREVLAGWVATPGQMLVRAGFLRDAGGWAARAIPAEDVALWLEAGETPAVFVPGTVLDYRIHSAPRPAADVERIEGELRAAFVARCDPAMRPAAMRIVAARTAIRQADAAFAANDPPGALRCLSRALRLAPVLIGSPILGPSLLTSLGRATAGTVLGPRGSIVARRFLRRLRAAQGRTELPS